MKRIIMIAVLAAALAALLAGTALAAGPVTPSAQGFGPGMGIHTPGTGMGPGGMAGRGVPAWAGQPDEVATLLGMTAEQIQAERLAGKSLVQIAAGKNISEDKLISTIIEAKTTDLAALVTASELTQAQADLMIEHMQTQVKTMVARTSVGPAAQRGQGQTLAGVDQASTGMGQGFRGGRGANR